MPKLFLFAAFLLCTPMAQAQWLNVTSAELPPYNVPAQLIRDHLTGPGIEILDVQFDGVPGAVGYFTGGDSTIGLHRGLVLSTGQAASSSPSTSIGADEQGSDFASTDNFFLLNDTMLAALTTGVLHDLVRYRITFRASSDSIRFRYVFASEEYPEYSCSSFNDAFGFFLEGPGYPTPINMARIPGTNLPVTINNIHPGYAIGCPAKNVQYFNNNSNTNKQPTYDGFLDVFVAEAAVEPCGVYTMTLALADVSDGVWDSGVFLEAKSFGSTEIVTASFEPGSAILPENAAADTVRLQFISVPANLLPLTVTLSGIAQNGVDYQLIDSVATITTTDTILRWFIQPLPDTLTESFETVVLTVRDTGCFSRTFTLFIADPDPEFRPVDTLVLAAASVLLTAPMPTALTDKTWSFSNPDNLSIAPVLTMLYAELNVGNSANPIYNVPFGTLHELSLLESVCINIQHGWVGDLSLYLFAPNGQFVELSSRNGANGDNYTSTCFSPAAMASITGGLPLAPASAAPFTGTFQPEGIWNDLVGAPVNGTWKLGIIDHGNGFVGQLQDWSLTFSGARIGDFHHLWSTGDTTPTISVAEPGIYSVAIHNDVSTLTKTFVVTALTAVNEPKTAASLHFSPNPALDQTLVSWDNSLQFSQLQVFDVHGRMVLSQKVDAASNIRLNTGGWAAGWYSVQLEGKDGMRAWGRLLVKN